jgi:hypothetical protein
MKYSRASSIDERLGQSTHSFFANLDRRAGKAVRSRHCPATVMRNETGNQPLPQARREGAGVGSH